MLTEHFVQSCQLVTAFKNAYGSRSLTSIGPTIPCRFRDILLVTRGANQEVRDSDAMLWVGPSAPIERGSLIKFENNFYQVEKATKARKLGSNVIEFIKCDLKVTSIAVS